MVWSDNADEYYHNDTPASPTQSRRSSFSSSSVASGMTVTTANFNSSSYYAPSVSSSRVVSSASISATPAEDGADTLSASASTADYDEDSLRYIPSAQLLTPPSPRPSDPFSQQTAASFSSSQQSTGPGSYLPSPPPSQPSIPTHKPIPAVQPPQAQPHHNHVHNQQATVVSLPNRSHNGGSTEYHRHNADISEDGTNAPPHDDETAFLLNAILQGMGRMHVSMEQDKAGRWRIKRTDDEELL